MTVGIVGAKFQDSVELGQGPSNTVVRAERGIDIRRCDAIGEQRPFEIVDARPPARDGRIAGPAKYLISTRYS